MHLSSIEEVMRTSHMDPCMAHAARRILWIGIRDKVLPHAHSLDTTCKAKGIMI